MFLLLGEETSIDFVQLRIEFQLFDLVGLDYRKSSHLLRIEEFEATVQGFDHQISCMLLLQQQHFGVEYGALVSRHIIASFHKDIMFNFLTGFCHDESLNVHDF